MKKKINPTNKERFLNSEPFKLTPFGSYYRYIGSSFGSEKGHLVQIYCESNSNKVLFEQYESNVHKIGPTTCKAFTYVLNIKRTTCLRYDHMEFGCDVETGQFEENTIEKLVL